MKSPLQENTTLQVEEKIDEQFFGIFGHTARCNFSERNIDCVPRQKLSFLFLNLDFVLGMPSVSDRDRQWRESQSTIRPGSGTSHSHFSGGSAASRPGIGA